MSNDRWTCSQCENVENTDANECTKCGGARAQHGYGHLEQPVESRGEWVVVAAVVGMSSAVRWKTAGAAAGIGTLVDWVAGAVGSGAVLLPVFVVVTLCRRRCVVDAVKAAVRWAAWAATLAVLVHALSVASSRT